MKYVFICVDTQNDYFTGKYKIPNTEVVLPNLAKLTEAAKKYGVKVVTTRGWYKPDSECFNGEPDYVGTFPSHCIMATEGAHVIDEAKPEQPLTIDWANVTLNFPEIHQSRNIVINKSDFLVNRLNKKEFADPFEGNTYMESLMHNLGIPIMDRPTYIIYGINVGATALGLMKRGYDVYVVNDANVNYNGMPMTKEDIIQTHQVTQEGGGMLGSQMGGMDYEAPAEDESIKFVNTKELIGE